MDFQKCSVCTYPDGIVENPVSPYICKFCKKAGYIIRDNRIVFPPIDDSPLAQKIRNEIDEKK